MLAFTVISEKKIDLSLVWPSRAHKVSPSWLFIYKALFRQCSANLFVPKRGQYCCELALCLMESNFEWHVILQRSLAYASYCMKVVCKYSELWKKKTPFFSFGSYSVIMQGHATNLEHGRVFIIKVRSWREIDHDVIFSAWALSATDGASRFA